MSKKETKRRLIIMGVLFWLGLLVCLGALGHLDYLTEQRMPYGIKEFAVTSVKEIIGIVLMTIGVYVGRDLEFDDEDEESEADEDDERDL